MKSIKESLNIFSYCRQYQVSIWACPPFLFVVMGLVTIAAVLVTYELGQAYTEPAILSLIVLFLAAFMLVISFIITHAFESVVEAKARETERAEELLRLRDQFVFVAAHELRTPATAIKWGIDALEEKNPDAPEQTKKFFEIIHESNERLLRLVQDMLQVARIENKTLKLDLHRLSLKEPAQKALEGIQHLASEREIMINNEIVDTIPVVKGDEQRISEVLDVLLRNACLYSSKGNTVWIRPDVKDDEVIVHVIDEGMGISESEQEHMFTKFWRGAEARKVEGSGLGLFIAKNLVELMHGRIWFRSKEGDGSVFSFSLPRASEPRV